MAQSDSSTPDYTLGSVEEFARRQRRHTAENRAAYLLPHLKPGLAVLDFACGAGGISIGLAKAVAPGELHGVDMEQSQIDLARAAARDSGCGNAIFHVGDVTRLPFEDDFFDVTHCHNVLLHVPDTGAVLSEVRRVLKPGGLIACRELVFGASVAHPGSERTKKLWQMYLDVLRADDGHPEIGMDLKNQLLMAGFTNVRASMSFTTFSEPEEISAFHDLVTEGFLSQEITDAAMKYRAWTEKMSQEVRETWDEWRNHPGAIAAFAYGEALADKP